MGSNGMIYQKVFLQYAWVLLKIELILSTYATQITFWFCSTCYMGLDWFTISISILMLAGYFNIGPQRYFAMARLVFIVLIALLVLIPCYITFIQAELFRITIM